MSQSGSRQRGNFHATAAPQDRLTAVRPFVHDRCRALRTCREHRPTTPTSIPTRFDDPAPDGCQPTDCSLREAIIAAEANRERKHDSRPGRDVQPDPSGGGRHDRRSHHGRHSRTTPRSATSISRRHHHHGRRRRGHDHRRERHRPGLRPRYGCVRRSSAASACATAPPAQGFRCHSHGGLVHNHATVILSKVSLSGGVAPAGLGRRWADERRRRHCDARERHLRAELDRPTSAAGSRTAAR